MLAQHTRTRSRLRIAQGGASKQRRASKPAPDVAVSTGLTSGVEEDKGLTMKKIEGSALLTEAKARGGRINLRDKGRGGVLD